MTDRYKNKYRIASARHPNWNYGSNAAYFVTICTKNRTCFFGEVINNKMRLSDIGKIAKSEWIKTPDMRPDMNLELGEFVIMPNHMHAIIIIGDNEYNNADRDAMHGRDAMHCVSTPKNQFGPQSKNLASIVRGYKIGVTTNARKIQRVAGTPVAGTPDFAWQPRFHDHIIRDDQSFHNISQYIINNPLNWTADKFHTK